jgi:hypothetical protein
MMRYRLMATYQGQPYEAGIGPTEADVVLFAACPPPEDLGFEPATGHWRKQLRLNEVQALWQSRPTGTFRGEPCIFLDDLGDRLHIAFLGHDAYQAEKLGYWQVDRGVFELITPHEEVLDIVEERTDYPYRPGGGAPQPPPALTPGTAPPAALVSRTPTGFMPAAPAPGFSPPAAPPGLGTATADPVLDPAMAGPSRIPPPRPGPVPPPATDTRPSPVPFGATPAGHQARAGVALPAYAEPPLPLEAAALRATSAASRQLAPSSQPPAQDLLTQDPLPTVPAARRRRAGPQRPATEGIFSELANLAAIPAASYAIGAEVDGAMCLLPTEAGFEVFNAAAGARHEVRHFDDEESAYFYLFGVLAAEAVRTGALVPRG